MPLRRVTPHCLCLARCLSASPEHQKLWGKKLDSIPLCFTPLIGMSSFRFLFLLGSNSATSSTRHEGREKVLKYSLKDKGLVQCNTNIQIKDYSCNSNTIILPASLCVFSLYTSYQAMHSSLESSSQGCGWEEGETRPKSRTKLIPVFSLWFTHGNNIALFYLMNSNVEKLYVSSQLLLFP